MKLKRFFTGVLSAVMALSVCALPAAADDNATTGAATTSKYTTSTIDTGKEGSITIYKRSMTSALPTEPAGKGETTAPEGEPLENVGFTIYRVMDAGELVKYYDGITEGNAVTYKDYFDSGATEFTASTLRKDVKSKEVKGLNGESGEKKTDVDGKVEFTGLKVGLYLVIETALPQAVTQKADPFLVSIPMTRIGAGKDETENPNNKVWMYDVTVYPKNSIAQGDVILEKKGVTGSDTAKAVGLDGVKFTLYRKSDTDGKYTPVADCTDKETANGQIQFSNLRKGSYYIMETGYADKADAGYILDTKAKYAFAIDKDGKVAENTDLTGADVVNGTKGVFDIDPTASKLTVYNYKPEFEKTVESRTGTSSTDKHQADYGIGDKVPYTLTIKVPENVAKLHTFKVVDTTLEDQLKHIPDEFKLTATDKDGSEQTLAENTAYKETITAGTDTNKKTTSILTVDFTTTALTNVAGGTITIKYYATLGAGAVVAENGNLNTAKLLYSRKTDTVDGTGETDKPYEITDEGVVYTFMTSIEKKGKGGSYNDKPMQGVTFALYRKVEDAEWNTNEKVTIAGQEYTKKGAVTGATAVKLGLATTESETWVQIYHDGKLEAATNDKGIVEYKGLPSGTYKFIETKTLDKYNLLTSPVDAKLSLSYTTTWKDTSTYDANGNLTNHKSYTVKYENGNDEVKNPNEAIKVVNRSGFTLPVTGGFGTLLFSGIGVLLVLAGVAVLFSMKKKNDRA